MYLSERCSLPNAHSFEDTEIYTLFELLCCVPITLTNRFKGVIQYNYQQQFNCESFPKFNYQSCLKQDRTLAQIHRKGKRRRPPAASRFHTPVLAHPCPGPDSTTSFLISSRTPPTYRTYTNRFSSGPGRNYGPEMGSPSRQ